jgi:hypothetical protein
MDPLANYLCVAVMNEIEKVNDDMADGGRRGTQPACRICAEDAPQRQVSLEKGQE